MQVRHLVIKVLIGNVLLLPECVYVLLKSIGYKHFFKSKRMPA